MKPRIFIGSSNEAKELCGALQSSLKGSAEVSAWHFYLRAKINLIAVDHIYAVLAPVRNMRRDQTLALHRNTEWSTEGSAADLTGGRTLPTRMPRGSSPHCPRQPRAKK